MIHYSYSTVLQIRRLNLMFQRWTWYYTYLYLLSCVLVFQIQNGKGQVTMNYGLNQKRSSYLSIAASLPANSTTLPCRYSGQTSGKTHVRWFNCSSAMSSSTAAAAIALKKRLKFKGKTIKQQNLRKKCVSFRPSIESASNSTWTVGYRGKCATLYSL